MSSFLDCILNIDMLLMKTINIHLSNPLFDSVMPLFDKPILFIFPLILFWIFSILKLKNYRWHLAVLIPLGILLTDQTGTAIKKLELRNRPWTVYEDVNHLGGKGGKTYSFPSNHAANSSFLANGFGFFYPQFKWILLVFAGIVGYSRIYIGVHYPLDVCAGFILGWLAAKLLLGLAGTFFKVNSAKHHPAS